MTKKTIRNLLLIILFLSSTNAFAQEVFNINLSITDTVIMVNKKKIIVKKIKRSSLFAIQINAELNIPKLQDSVVFHSFNKYVPSFYFINDFSPDTYKRFSSGLLYVIEDEDNCIISPPFPSHSSNVKINQKRKNERMFVSPKLKIERKLLTIQEQRDYDLAKYVVYKEKQSMVLYPLLGEHHSSLPKGEYYLYFVYSYYNLHVPPPEMIVEGKLDEGNVFRGYFVSNKVKLIVE